MVVVGCAKWQDPPATTDSRLTNPYCNDPKAVNFNWGFPGKPDNTVCFYPTDLFTGTYIYTDSVYTSPDNYFLYYRIDTLHFIAQSQTKVAVTGFCLLRDTLRLTADKSYIAAVDTLIGDSTTNRGQYWCRIKDTVSGTILNSRLDTMLHVSFQIISDTGTTLHIGKAKKI
ncbi:MAG: hypothetical protein EBX41_00545 [Chitinophagia bacterium]|nr:hypothetical protein [Chitinophagia bacterium]